MTDMRRTLLWGVFLVSLFLIYDAGNFIEAMGDTNYLTPTISRSAR